MLTLKKQTFFFSRFFLFEESFFGIIFILRLVMKTKKVGIKSFVIGNDSLDVRMLLPFRFKTNGCIKLNCVIIDLYAK